MKHNLGTFNHCSNCKLKKNCCSSFDKIDAPILSENEMTQLLNADNNNIFVKNDNCYVIKIKGNICPFYKNGCSVYENRPLDCRLFPFDIKHLDGKFFLVLYELGCRCEKIEENVDELVELIKPYILDFTKPSLNIKSNSLPYKIIKEIYIDI